MVLCVLVVCVGALVILVVLLLGGVGLCLVGGGVDFLVEERRLEVARVLGVDSGRVSVVRVGGGEVVVEVRCGRRVVEVGEIAECCRRLRDVGFRLSEVVAGEDGVVLRAVGEVRWEGELGKPLSRWVVGALWKLAVELVGEALRRAGVRGPGEFGVDGLGPKYVEFLLALREGLNKVVKGGRLEMRVETYGRGLGDTHVFIDHEYLYTWRPEFDAIAGGFRAWVRRVYNLLKELAERDAIKDEVLRKKELEELVKEVLKSRPEVLV